MENVLMNAAKDTEDNDNSLDFLDRSIKLIEGTIVLPGMISKVKLEHLMLLNSKIPRQIISFDEQYLRCCLELIKINALRAISCNVPLDVSTVFGQLSSRKISGGNACDWNGNVFECPGVAGDNSFVVSSPGDSILGAITESKSMINILNSPLLCQMGPSDHSVNFGITSLVDIGETIHPINVTSPVGSDATSSEKVRKEALVLGDHIYGYEPAPNRLSSLSSTNSTRSDHSSSSALMSQGMLHCTWNNGSPHYVFSIDDQTEIYIANLLKAESPEDKVLDFMYIFHRRSVGKKDDVIPQKESELVGKMKVTTSFTLLLPGNTQIKETQFVLFGINDDCWGDMRTPSHTLKKSLFSKNFFKASHTHKKKRSFKLGVSSSKLENPSLNPSQGSTSNLEPASRISLSEDHFSPNLELAAIVLKTQISYQNNKTNLGGWGLNFLKKGGNAQTDASVEKEVSQNYLHENGDCSTSTDILIPAGFHGVPRTKDGGPSSLSERWKSGGHCDCGGWDSGCPLTVLNARSIRTDISLQSDVHWESKTFDFLVEGSKQEVPIMKMVSIHDDLYCISFQSTLSAIQSFSIATAIIHAHSPTIQPSPYKVKLQDRGSSLCN